MSDEHRRGLASNNFCAVAHDGNGKCKQDYVKNCEGEAAGWDTYSQMKKFRNKKTGRIRKLESSDRSFEAHHIAPVACVTEVVIAWDKKSNAKPSVVTGTKWCINAKVNMIALPVWGHTIRHYCNNFDDLSDEVQQEISDANVASVGKTDLVALSDEAKDAIIDSVTADTAPPFKNLPQHNYGHTGKSAETGYNEEIIDKLNQIVVCVELAQGAHQTDKINEIQSELDNLSKEMRQTLKDRAKRAYKGTHQAWKAGMKKADCTWYKSFSMAAEPSKMTFPLKKAGGDMGEKLIAAARALF